MRASVRPCVLGVRGKPEASPKLHRGPPSARVRKQAVVSALLLGQAVENEWGDVVRSGERETEDHLVERVARIMFDGATRRLHWMVGIGLIDKTKQVAVVSRCLVRGDWSVCRPVRQVGYRANADEVLRGGQAVG
jgi:hypothetical protein